MADRHKRPKVFETGGTDCIIKPLFKEELFAGHDVHMHKTLPVKEMQRVKKSTAKPMRITGHETKAYTDGIQIIDIDKASSW